MPRGPRLYKEGDNVCFRNKEIVFGRIFLGVSRTLRAKTRKVPDILGELINSG